MLNTGCWSNLFYSECKCIYDGILFSEKHCQERHYVFQIRRCSDAECYLPPSREWQWLPDPILDYTGKHYKPFESVLGTVTTEKDRPSFMNQTIAAVAQEQQVSKFIK